MYSIVNHYECSYRTNMKNQNLKSKNQATIKQDNDVKVASPELDKISIEELNKVSGGLGYGEWW